MRLAFCWPFVAGCQKIDPHQDPLNDLLLLFSGRALPAALTSWTTSHLVRVKTKVSKGKHKEKTAKKKGIFWRFGLTPSVPKSKISNIVLHWYAQLSLLPLDCGWRFVYAILLGHAKRIGNKLAHTRHCEAASHLLQEWKRTGVRESGLHTYQHSSAPFGVPMLKLGWPKQVCCRRTCDLTDGDKKANWAAEGNWPAREQQERERERQR